MPARPGKRGCETAEDRRRAKSRPGGGARSRRRSSIRRRATRARCRCRWKNATRTQPAVRDGTCCAASRVRNRPKRATTNPKPMMVRPVRTHARSVRSAAKKTRGSDMWGLWVRQKSEISVFAQSSTAHPSQTSTIRCFYYIFLRFSFVSSASFVSPLLIFLAYLGGLGGSKSSKVVLLNATPSSPPASPSSALSSRRRDRPCPPSGRHRRGL